MAAAAASGFDQFTMALPQLGNDPAAVRKRIEMLELVPDRALIIPGTQMRFGLDSVIGLVPGVGDIISGLMGAYIIWEARNLKMSKWTLWRMAGTVGIDTALGAIPFVGDLFDVAFRSNTRNLRLIKRHLDRHHPASAIINA